jgi:hypothetical protein
MTKIDASPAWCLLVSALSNRPTPHSSGHLHGGRTTAWHWAPTWDLFSSIRAGAALKVLWIPPVPPNAVVV